jgi:hypothetical protein
VKKVMFAAAALVAAVAVFVGVTAPPKPLPLVAAPDGTIAGVIHIHTNRSDGLSSPDEIAAAAARAGLRFIAFSDHGDGTRKPDPPQYRAGVLCFDGVEISTTGGHYVAIDLAAASPYPIAGEPRDVVEDVRRLGGFGIAAHPDSPKPQLQWRGWTTMFDAIELLNPDTAWRVWMERANQDATRWAARRKLFASIVDYPFRPAEVMANLIPPSGAVDEWEAQTRRRRVVAIAGADAHAKIAPRSADAGDSRFALPFPGYEPSLRVLSVHAKVDRPLTGNAAIDAPMVMRAIRTGHLYTAVDAVAGPPSFEFTAESDRGIVNEGDEIGAGGRVTLRVRSNAPEGFTTTIWRGPTALTSTTHNEPLTIDTPGEPAVYRVEIRATARPNPLTWIRSNPIYVRGAELLPRPAAPAAAAETRPIFDGTMTGWRVEHDPTSLGVAEPVGERELRFRFGLAGGPPGGQVAALVYDTPDGIARYTRVSFSIRAERPMRVSVQLRDGGEPAGRWQRSVYVDAAQLDHTVLFADMTAVAGTPSQAPNLAAVRSILFVVDANNTKPGTSSVIRLRPIALER